MKHLHLFAKEVDLTIEEWLAACDVVRMNQVKLPPHHY